MSAEIPHAPAAWISTRRLFAKVRNALGSNVPVANARFAASRASSPDAAMSDRVVASVAVTLRASADASSRSRIRIEFA